MFGIPQNSVTKVRRVFFSFHYQNDIIRANQVRNSWRFQKEDRRIAGGFFDGSIWEKSQRTGPESLKTLIREGIKNTSVTAVLVGQETWSRRWVRYEIARSVVKGKVFLLSRFIYLMTFIAAQVQRDQIHLISWESTTMGQAFA